MKFSVVLVLICTFFHTGLTQGRLPTSARQSTLPYLNICFILDSSSTATECFEQKKFVDDIAKLGGTDGRVSFAAVTATRKKPFPVSPLSKLIDFRKTMSLVKLPRDVSATVKYKKALRKCEKILKKTSQVRVTILSGS